MRLKYICWLVVLAIVDLSIASMPKEVVRQIETNLLTAFGFKRRPKIDRSKVIIPQALLELHDKMNSLPDTVNFPRRQVQTKNANTVRSFTHIESPIDARFPNHHKFRLKFNVKHIPKEESLKAAELSLFRDTISWLSQEYENPEFFQRVLIHDIIKPGVKSKHGTITRLLDTKVIDTKKNFTLSFDVSKAVHRWLENPKSNHGLLVLIKTKNSAPVRHVRLRRSADDTHESWSASQPLLFAYTDDGKNKQKTASEMASRPRRATRKHGRRKDDKREPCRRHNLYVNFNDVGWSDWIVAPPGYDAYYCHGECNFPMAEHLNTTNHAIVQTLMNSVRPSQVPKACCVPTQLNSISMLYVDDDSKVVLKNYKDMVAIGCGCR